VRGGYRKFHNKKLHDLYMSTKNIIWAIQFRKKRWPGNVVYAKKCMQVIDGETSRKETTCTN